MHKLPIILSFFFICFISKIGWNQCETFSIDNHVVCDSFTWIDGLTYTSSNNTAVHTLVGANAVGCDSIVTLNLVLKNSSIKPSIITSSDSIICANNDLFLNLNGGLLGTNGQWVWYKDSCSGNSIGTGPTITVNQTANTTYFVRAEGDCNNTLCENITVENYSYFIELDSLTIDSTYNSTDSSWSIIDSVCPQSAVQLFAHYSETFPLGYSITWYKKSCGSFPIGVGDSITVYPDSTTSYYARVTGTCGASLCKSVTIFTKDGSIAPSGVLTTSNNFCSGDSTNLSLSGGNLGTGAVWNWYESSCGTNSIGSGPTITVVPHSTTMYYVRANGGICGSTSCEEILLNIYNLNVYHSPIDSLCDLSPIILQGGFPRNGTYSGNGILDSIFDPNISGIGAHTITYSYTDSNNCTDSTQFPVVVLEPNFDPISISANAYEICNGNSTTINLDNSNQLISASQWVWYQGSCGTGQVIGTANNQISVSPTTTTNYYVRAEGGYCPSSNCIGVTIDVYTLETNLLEIDDICGEDHPEFELTGGTPSGGIYSGSGVSNGSFNPINAGIGNHNITYTYTLGPCVATDVETIQINVSPITVDYSTEIEICSEGGIMIHAHPRNGLGFYSYQWSDGSLENPLMFAEIGSYNVLVSDANECYSLLENIQIDRDLECIDMTNTFSPNNDGINDFWNLNFQNYDNLKLIILNKWGNKIIDYSGNNSYQWDGKNIDGGDLPSGTYYYIIELSVNGQQPIDQTGPITLIR